MPRKSFNDRTLLKHDKLQKEAWKKKAKKLGFGNLSAWIRESLDRNALPSK
jgi:hypothetical protein